MLNQDDDLFNVLNLDTPSHYQGYYDSEGDEAFDEYDCFLKTRQGFKEKLEVLPSTAESQQSQFQNQIEEEQEQEDCQSEIELSQKNDQITDQSPPDSTAQAFLQQIQFSSEKMAQRKLTLQGYDYETQNIGKHLKTSTCSYLTLLIQTSQLEPEEEEAAKQFSGTNGAIQDFKKLFEAQGMRVRCREYYESQLFIQNIMKSPRMDFQSKLAMLRYLEKFRQMTFKQPEKWKMDSI